MRLCSPSRWTQQVGLTSRDCRGPEQDSRWRGLDQMPCDPVYVPPNSQSDRVEVISGAQVMVTCDWFSSAASESRCTVTLIALPNVQMFICPRARMCPTSRSCPTILTPCAFSHCAHTRVKSLFVGQRYLDSATAGGWDLGIAYPTSSRCGVTSEGTSAGRKCDHCGEVLASRKPRRNPMKSPFRRVILLLRPQLSDHRTASAIIASPTPLRWTSGSTQTAAREVVGTAIFHQVACGHPARSVARRAWDSIPRPS